MLLVENVLASAKIVESNRSKLPEGVLLRVTYPICNIGELNANNRMYERDVWDAVGKDESINDKMANRCLFGQAEHPEETMSDLQLTSHVIFETWIDESDNKAYQKLDVLDTPMGRIIETLLKAGCGVGMSTRAEGDLEDVEGEMDEATGEKKTYQKVIAETYRYVTTDFTADPSTFGVAPKDLEFNLCQSVAKSTREGKMNLAEKKFATKILESIQCSDKECGETNCIINECIAELNEGIDQRGERDGSGPYKGSAQRSISKIGKKKQAGNVCPNEVEVDEDKIDETEDITAMYKAAGLPAPDGKGIHTKAFHKLAIEVAKGYKKEKGAEKAMELGYATAMKQLGKEKAVKADHRSESKVNEFNEGSFKDWFAANENSDELHSDYEQAKADMEEVDPDSVPDFKTWARARFDALQESKIDEVYLSVVHKEGADEHDEVEALAKQRSHGHEFNDDGTESLHYKYPTLEAAKEAEARFRTSSNVVDTNISESKIDEGHGFAPGNTLKDNDGNHFVVKELFNDGVSLESAGGGVGATKKLSWEEIDNRGIYKVAEASEIANEMIDLRIKEATSRAELESALADIKNMPDWDIQCKILHEKLNAAKKHLTKNMNKRSEVQEELKTTILELKAGKVEIEAVCSILEKKSVLVKETQKKLDEAKEHQISLDALARQHQVELTECANNSIKEGRKEVIEKYFEIKITDHRLEVDDNSRALLENCEDLQEVDSLVERLVNVARKSALHSKPFTSIEIREAKEVVDPEQKKADDAVGHLMENMR